MTPTAKPFFYFLMNFVALRVYLKTLKYITNLYGPLMSHSNLFQVHSRSIVLINIFLMFLVQKSCFKNLFFDCFQSKSKIWMHHFKVQVFPYLKITVPTPVGIKNVMPCWAVKCTHFWRLSTVPQRQLGPHNWLIREWVLLHIVGTFTSACPLHILFRLELELWNGIEVNSS